MPQIFRRRANAFYRLLLLGTPLALVGLLVLSVGWKASSYETEVGIAREQPVPFSHKHHVSGLGIDCRYCHTTVETSAYAGMPTAHTCMSCHSQIWAEAPLLAPLRESQKTGVPIAWNRVHRLPDHVYFNHSAHVSQGVSCRECHGEIERMPLTWKARAFTMKDCLDCHRQQEHTEPARLTSCNTCHR